MVEGTRLTKVLMDGGSGLNILYAETLKGMGILMSRFSGSNMSFHWVIPGKKAASLGQITLEVVFGDAKNYRKEKLTFKSWIFRVRIMQFWAGRLMHDSWLDLVTCTSNWRCLVPEE